MNTFFKKCGIFLLLGLLISIRPVSAEQPLRRTTGAQLLDQPPAAQDIDKTRLLRIITINVNLQTVADSHLIITPSGKTLLIDAGWPPPRDHAKVVLSFLKREGIRRIDQMMASHFHIDHFGAMPEILHSNEVTIGELLWSPLPLDKLEKLEPSEAKKTKDLEEKIRKECAEKNVPIKEIKTGDILDLEDGVTGRVLAAAEPDIETKNYINNNSIVMRLAYKNFSMLFAGDAGFEEEKRIMSEHKDIVCDVLKIGHHAGAGSTGEDWIKAVNAKVGVAPMPKYLSEDPRGLRVWNQLAPTSIKVYRTWEHGNIEINTDGNRFWILTEK
ncbi:MAG: MBL fold metallo-hydrolase [Verrucomicrobiae bacterium]|nr:MBL fold metallo-hydrolase [Verrucomicrobiae bacterium]